MGQSPRAKVLLAKYRRRVRILIGGRYSAITMFDDVSWWRRLPVRSKGDRSHLRARALRLRELATIMEEMANVATPILLEEKRDGRRD